MNTSNSYKSIVSFIYLTAVIMEVIDITIINVALPQIQSTLSAPMHLMGWMTNGYVLSLATAIPISSWLGERFGTKKILMLGIALFTFASIWCGLSSEINSLILGRVLQGIGGGMLVPVGQTILFRTFGAREIPNLLSKLAIPITLAPALGQTVGGFIVTYFDWHWIFWVNIPFGILCLLGTQIYLNESEPKKAPIDFFGLILSCLSIFILFYSFSLIDFQADLVKPTLYFLVACLLFVVFIFYEKNYKHAFFNFKVFEGKNFGIAIGCNLLILSNVIGTFFVSNFILQETIGWSAMEAGITAIPFSIGFLIAFKILPKIYPNKVSGKTILLIANSCCIIACGLMTVIHTTAQFNILLALIFIRGLGFGFLVITLQAIGLRHIKPSLMNDASTIITLTRYTFMGFGTAFFILLTIILMNLYDMNPVSFTANKTIAITVFHWLFTIATTFITIGFYFILKIDEKEENVASKQELEKLGDRIQREQISE